MKNMHFSNSILRYAVLLICFLPMALYAHGAQGKRIILKGQSITMQQAIQLIEENSQYTFFFKSGVIANDEKKDYDCEGDINEILRKVFSNSGIDYVIKNNEIILKSAKAEAVQQKSQGPKKSEIVGVVVDANTGESIIGASVQIKGAATGVITNIDGKFTIMAAPSDVILISYVGYTPKEIKIGSRKVLSIDLNEDAKQLEEVVITAYGTGQKKASMVGSVESIKPAELKVPSTNLSTAFAGRLAGVIAVQKSGQPGADGANFWIRGVSTMNGVTDPLIILDGVQVSSSDLNNLDPEIIDSFSILKDAAASAVYGVRGANGVILINTKRGKIGKPSVDIRFEQGITFLGKTPDYIGAYDYASLVNAIAKEEGNQIPYSQEDLEKYRTGSDPDLYPDVNWIDAITKKFGTNSRVNLDVTGGSDILRYSLVGSYYNTRGIMDRDKSYEWDNSDRLNRFSLRSNVDVNITPTTLLRVNIGGFLQDHTLSAGKKSTDGNYASLDEIFQTAFTTSPIAHPTRYSTGEIPVVANRANPWAWLTQTGYQTRKESSLETLFSIEQDLSMLVKGLKIKGLFSFDRYSASGVRRSKNPTYYQPANGRNPDGTLNLHMLGNGDEYLDYSSYGEYGTNSTYTEFSANYANTFGKHGVQGMFMYDMRNLDTGDKQPFRFMGIAGRFSYTFDNRYVTEFNFGYNGSENFAKGKRYGFFPSVALGWIVSEEKFMEPVRNVLSKLKLRGSYGLVGNDCIGATRGAVRFPYITTIDEVSGYTFGMDGNVYIGGMQEGLAGSPDLTWEKVKKLNIGVEVGILNTINLTVDFFQDKRYDIFMQRVNVPSSTGFTNNPYANYGKTTNKGVELSLEMNKRFSKDFEVMAQATMTYAKSRIDEIDEPVTVIGTNRARTGRPIGQIYGYIDEGLFTEDDFADVANGILKEGIPVPQFSNNIRPGDIKYKDVNNDGIINALDQSPIGGTWDPMLVYGFGLNMRYKNIDFGFFLQGNGKTYRIIGSGVKTFIPGTGANTKEGNIYSNYQDRWTPENPSQNVFWPRLSSTINENNTQPSTWWVRNMSMLRVKSIELGYSFSKKSLLPHFISNARLFVACSNPFEFSKFKMWDPELDTSTGAKYPIPRVVSFGFNLSF